jgi:hypothetical protein
MSYFIDIKLRQNPDNAIKLKKKKVNICKRSLITPLKLSEPLSLSEDMAETIKNGKKHEISPTKC